MTSRMPEITFVTAYIKIPDMTSNDIVTNSFDNFDKLQRSGINILAFIDEEYRDYMENNGKKYLDNVNVVFTSFDSLQLSSIKDTHVELPNKVSSRDTVNFMILMDSKLEFIKRAQEVQYAQGIPKTKRYAWIDFRLLHVIRDHDTALKYLQMLNVSELKDDFLAFPGCNGYEMSDYMNEINWHFCGGFFCGTVNALNKLYTIWYTELNAFISKNNKIVWETNFYAHLDRTGLLKDLPIYWYTADHNDSIIHIPAELLVIRAQQLTEHCWLIKSTKPCNLPEAFVESLKIEINELATININDDMQLVHSMPMTSCPIPEKQSRLVYPSSCSFTNGGEWTVTYVTSYFSTEMNGNVDKQATWYFNQLPDVPTVLFLSNNLRNKIQYKKHLIVCYVDSSIPKLSLIMRVLQMNPYRTLYYSWIDFNILSLCPIERVFDCSSKLYSIAKTRFATKFLRIAGNWPAEIPSGIILDYINDQILRFYGNFFIGDVESILNLFNITVSELDEFVSSSRIYQMGKTINETGYWYYLEKFRGVHFDWYFATYDHQIIMNFPSSP